MRSYALPVCSHMCVAPLCSQMVHYSHMVHYAGIAHMLNCPIFKTDLIRHMATVTALPTMSQEDKTAFYNSLPSLISSSSLPLSLAESKLLPALLSSIHLCASNLSLNNNRHELLATITPLMTISVSLSDETFNKTIGNIMAPLFLVNDRAVRGALLHHLPTLVQRLPATDINCKIFEPVCTGEPAIAAPPCSRCACSRGCSPAPIVKASPTARPLSASSRSRASCPSWRF